jgi:hypothetical protein
MPTSRARRVIVIAAGLACAVGLSSCATDPFEPLAEALLGPKEERRAKAEAERTGAQQGTHVEDCQGISLVAPIDVDTAYARVMSRLRFRTLDERKHVAAKLSMGLIDEGFRHTAQPGAYYRMADLVGWNTSSGAREAAWLEVELTRDAPRRTLFNGKYCLATNDPNFGNAVFRASLEQRLRDAVK